jgi:anhydro-N-acetylmuramic acid kinase
MPAYYLGLMSGTSLDGIDAAILDFDTASPRQHFARTYPLPVALREQVLGIINAGGHSSIDSIGRLDQAFGKVFADVALTAIQDSGIAHKNIAAIGSHGQTLWHAPDGEDAFTWQIADPNVIAARTGLPVVADLRRKDMAHGGQGAPLASRYHRELFSHLVPVAVVNLGGIANATVIINDNEISGFDTGPANGLMDAWHEQHFGESIDRDGKWAASGQVIEALLERMLSDPFFSLPAPKSTGREWFNKAWLLRHLQGDENPADIQATLCELTARSVADSLRNHTLKHVVIVGGGARNPHLMQRLAGNLNPIPVSTSDQYGYGPDFIEAGAFAWLAMRRMAGLPGNVPGVTGARCETVLGAIHLP